MNNIDKIFANCRIFLSSIDETNSKFTAFDIQLILNISLSKKDSLDLLISNNEKGYHFIEDDIYNMMLKNMARSFIIGNYVNKIKTKTRNKKIWQKIKPYEIDYDAFFVAQIIGIATMRDKNTVILDFIDVQEKMRHSIEEEAFYEFGF